MTAREKRRSLIRCRSRRARPVGARVLLVSIDTGRGLVSALIPERLLGMVTIGRAPADFLDRVMDTADAYADAYCFGRRSDGLNAVNAVLTGGAALMEVP